MAEIGKKLPAEEGTTERTALIAHALCHEIHQCLKTSSREADDIDLGLLMGLAMYLDEKLGPFRAERLMCAAPQIILRTDAHVTPKQAAAVQPILRRLGRVLANLP
jgi:hypothetical protein